MSLITSTAFSQPNPTPTSPRNSPSLSTQLINLNNELTKIEGSLQDGYYTDANTVARLSTSTFTVLTDRTAYYTAGRVVRFNNTAFGTVISSSYNGGTGLTTVIINETTVPNPLTSVDISLQPRGAANHPLISPTIITPTITSPTVTGGTYAGSTLTKPTINGSVQALTPDTDGATITFDMAAANVHSVTLGGNRTLAVTNVTSGQSFVLILKQDATGSRVPTWWANIKWVGATIPTLTTTAGRWDIFAFIYDGTNYYGSIVGLNFG